MAKGSGDSVGFLGFDIGVDEKAISDLLKQVENLRKQAEQALNLKSGSSLLTTLKEVQKNAAPLQKTFQNIAKDGRSAGAALDAVGKSGNTAGSGVARVKKEVDPLQKSIKDLQNTTSSYRNIIEATDVSNKDAVDTFTQLRNSALGAAKGLDDTTKEYRDLTGVAAQAARSIKTLTGEQTRLGFSGNTVVGVNRSMLGGFRNLIGVVGGLSFAGAIKGSFDYATNLEQLGVSFETILGSGEAAKDLLTELEGFAASTPFQFPELANAAKSLAAFGVAGDDIVPTLQRVGDVSAGVGASVGEIAEIYGKARVQGRLFAEDINQLTGRGIPVIQELAKQFGVAESEVKKLVESGQVDFGNLEQAFVSLTSEGGKFFGLTQAQSETTAGKLSTLADNATAAGGQFIEVLLPSLEKTVDVASAVAGGLADMDPGLRALVVQGGLGSAALIPLTAGLGGIVSVAPKVVTGFKAMQVASAALLAPPAGLFIAGAALAVGLGVALKNMADNAPTVAKELDALNTTVATNAENLDIAKTAIEGLQDVSDEDGFTGVVETLASTLDEKGSAALKSFAANAVISQGSLQEAVQATIAEYTNLEITSTRVDLNAAEALLTKAQEAYQSYASLVEQAQYEFENPEAFASAGIQVGARLDEYKTKADEASERVQELGTVVDTLSGQLTTLESAQATVNDETLTTEQRLERLGGLFGAVGDSVSELAGPIKDVPPVPPSVPASVTDVATALEATTALAARIGSEFEAGARQAGSALDALQVPLGELIGQRDALLASGNYDPADLKALNSQITVLETALDQISPDTFSTLGLGASTAYDPIAGLRTQLQGTNDDLALSQDTTESWGEVHERVYGESGRAATEAAELESEAFRERAKDQAQYAADAEELAVTLAYYSREAETSFDQTEANGEAIERSTAIIHDRIAAEDEWSERMSLSTGWVTTQTEAQETLTKTLKGDFAKSYDVAIERAELFGESQTGTAAEMERLQQEIEYLLDNGLEPNDKAIQELIKRYLELKDRLEDQAEANENYQANLEDVTNAQEALGDASGIATEDIDELIAGLEEAALGTGELGEQARQAKTDLEALEVARDLAGLFDAVGASARLALEGIPGLSEPAKGALGGLADAADQMSAALSDGVVTPQEGIKALGGLVDGLAEGFRDQLSPGAYAAVKAIDGVASAAVSFATGDIIGGVTTLISTAVQGITDYFQEANREAERLLEISRDIKETNQNTRENTIDTIDEQNEFRRDQGGPELTYIITDTQVELLRLQDEFTEKMLDSRRRRAEALEGIDPNSPEGKRVTASFDGEERSIRENTRTSQAAIIQGGVEQAEAAGYSGELFVKGITDADTAVTRAFPESATYLTNAVANYTQLAEGALIASGNTLGEASEVNRQAVADLNQQLVDLFGPEAAEPIRQAILAAYNKQAGAVTEGNETLTTAAVESGPGPRQAIADINQALVDILGDAAGPIKAQILAAFNAQAGALGEGETTLTTQAGTTGTAVGEGFKSIFGSTQDILATEAPVTNTSLTNAFQALQGITATESDLFGGALTRQGGVLSGGLASFFGGQRSTTNDEAELSRQKLEDELERIRKEFQASVSGAQGLTATIGRGETSVSGFLTSFFGSQRSTVGTESTETVNKINSAADDVRKAIQGLIGASGARAIAGRAAGGGGGGGGGGGRNSFFGMFAPLNSFVDERAIGGMGEFGDFSNYQSSIVGEMEGEGNTFGYGTSANTIQPVGESGAGGSRAGPLAGLLASVRAGVDAYKMGVVSSLNSAVETQTRGFQALGYNFRRGIIEESKRNKKLVKEQKKTNQELKDAFIGSFELVGGATLLKKIGGPSSYLYDFALQIGQSIESGFRSGVEGGAKAFLDGTGTMLETLQRDAFDQLAFGTIQKLLSSGLVEKLLGGVYTDFAAALAGGDTNDAIAAFQKVMAKLPSVAGQIESILAPIKGIGQSLGYGGSTTAETENLGQGIRLEARSLGSATPDWALRFGQAADRISQAADINFKAAERFYAAVARFDKGGGKLEARKPNRLTKF